MSGATVSTWYMKRAEQQLEPGAPTVFGTVRILDIERRIGGLDGQMICRENVPGPMISVPGIYPGSGYGCGFKAGIRRWP